MMELNADPPRQRQDWIGAADSEASALVRQPLHENRKITMKLRVSPRRRRWTRRWIRSASLVDKLRSASASPDGVALVWTPTDSARSRTFTVLAGEIVGPARVDLQAVLARDGDAHVDRESSTPFVTLEIAGVTGDVPPSAG
jgi:hypothetical protein